jgi:hypothetical protein
MTDLRVIDAYLKAQDGDFRLLADVIEAGYNLDETTRKFLAKYLRGEVKFSRGNRRTFAAKMEDARVLSLVRRLEENEGEVKRAANRLGLKYKRRGSNRLYLDLFPNVNSDTLRSQLKRARAEKRRTRKRRINRVSK